MMQSIYQGVVKEMALTEDIITSTVAQWFAIGASIYEDSE
jgi:hypothetical protein